MNYQDLLNSLTPEIYDNLKRAVELGKWPDGRVVTPEQRQHCMEAVIAYEHKHLPPEQHTGYIPPKPHTHCGGEGEVAEADEPLKWK
ncbi:YeaC family protein [Marinimicrobium sp. LS-A18]|uniref:YeaC family protein n=1 Tax=Marinimicrobium sp. LS-A18 TaxID=1381596 RepID=UPI000465E3C2|nr:YeaC family protein [Marinimicrobium sp. LS-A18]